MLYGFTDTVPLRSVGAPSTTSTLRGSPGGDWLSVHVESGIRGGSRADSIGWYDDSLFPRDHVQGQQCDGDDDPDGSI